MKDKTVTRNFAHRRWLLVSIFFVGAGLLLWRAFYLQILNKDFLRDHGDARSLRTVSIPAHRGMITDRNNEPLAISTPVDSIWVIPEKVLEEEQRLPQLAASVGMTLPELKQLLEERITREFVYLKRQISPELAKTINSYEIPGVYLQREYKRYYPLGEVASHLIGFTNVDDNGQEGIELAYDKWLQGTPGEKRVLKDMLGRVVQNVESIRPSDPGKTLRLSIDRRVQYLAYRELKSIVAQHNARGGSLVMLDAESGEVMALAVQPSYNPNNRSALKSDNYRNRAITDVFEPGSTFKPITISAALVSNQYKPNSIVETGPGYLKVVDHTIRDANNYGALSLAGVIKKSSNVGASKIALALGPKPLWELYSQLGLGQTTGSGFPGESTGVLNHYRNWSEIELATASYGYGISVTALKLAQVYSVLANGGILQPISFEQLQEPVVGQRVLPAVVTQQIRQMLESVVQADGTGAKAAVPGYHVAGKTGTVRKIDSSGYVDDRHFSLFAGMAPARDPKLVMVVVTDEPRRGGYYGGQVSALVFSNVMKGALRILDIPPDDLPVFDNNMLIAGQHVIPGQTQ